MSKKKVLVVCHLTGSKCNGQEAKTSDAIRFLKDNDFDVEILNYGKLNPIQKIIKSFSAIKRSENIIIMPGGKKALFFYISIISRYKKKNAHYLAVGGWNLKLLQDDHNKKYFDKLKLFKGIYLQNQKSVDAYREKGFDNVHYVANFSYKEKLSNDDFKNRLNYLESTDEYKFCFFARVTREKGVLEACDAINQICKKHPDKKISFDIYGETLDPTLIEELDNISKSNPVISRKGVLDSERAISVLSHYYCMIFPTHYRGEGMPHTLVESFMAGLPVIASNWAYNAEIVENGKTGLIYELNTNELLEKIEYAIFNKKDIVKMSNNCCVESNKYDPQVLLKPLINNLNN